MDLVQGCSHTWDTFLWLLFPVQGGPAEFLNEVDSMFFQLGPSGSWVRVAMYAMLGVLACCHVLAFLVYCVWLWGAIRGLEAPEPASMRPMIDHLARPRSVTCTWR